MLSRPRNRGETSDRDTHLRDQFEREKRRKYGIMFWLFYAELMTTSVSAMRDNYRATTMADFPYGNVGHDPYRTRRCVKISSTMPICSKMAYKDMWLPNFMQHESISEFLLSVLTCAYFSLRRSRGANRNMESLGQSQLSPRVTKVHMLTVHARLSPESARYTK